MGVALIHISEYVKTRRMMTENRYRNEDLLAQLRAVFGTVDKIRDHIHRALQQDDAKGHEVLFTPHKVRQA